mgnify:FL=1|jgi:hypothetical protein
MKTFIHIRSSKFPILPGEKEELVNEEMYGKAVAQYLQANLQDRGYKAPFFCCEDWGWWVELKNAPFVFGVCIYSGPEREGPVDYFCTDNIYGQKKWSWSKFRFLDTEPWVKRLHEDLITIFRADPKVDLVNAECEAPFAANENSTSDRAGISHRAVRQDEIR